MVGANPTEAHPVVGARVKQPVLRGARLIVIDPRRTELASIADVHLAGRPGSNVAVFYGLAHVLLRGNWSTRRSSPSAPTASRSSRLWRRTLPSGRGAPGVPVGELHRAARLYGAPTARHLYGLGVTEHAHGTDGVRALANLAVLGGRVGTAGGCGIIPLRRQNNVQGASDMGARPTSCPVTSRWLTGAIRRHAKVWGVGSPSTPALRMPAMFDASVERRLNALYVMGEDIVQTDPDMRTYARP